MRLGLVSLSRVSNFLSGCKCFFDKRLGFRRVHRERAGVSKSIDAPIARAAPCVRTFVCVYSFARVFQSHAL